MKIRLVSLLLCFSVFSFRPVFGDVRSLYLSVSGNDGNAGTENAPLASMEEIRKRIGLVCASADKPDTLKIHVAPGVYPLFRPLVLDAALTGGVPLLFEGEPGSETVFCGGFALTPFVRVSDRLWKTYVPEAAEKGFYFEQMYVNGERRFRAQSPNRGEFHAIRNVVQTVLDSTGGERMPRWAVLRVEPDSVVALSGRPAAVPPLITFYHKWDVTRRPLLHREASGALYCAGEGMKSWNPVDARSRFVIENDIAFLDAPGEWFLDRDGWLYYIPCEGETPEETVCTVPVTDRFVVIQGTDTAGGRVENIVFRNLSFETAGYRTPWTGNEPAQAAAPIGAVIEADYARHIRFENCTVAHTGLGGIWFRRACTDCGVEHCRLYDLGAGGVKIGETALPADESLLTRRITIDNNIIQHGGYVFPCAVGVAVFHASDNRITHNDIADFRYTGVSVGWVWGYGHSPAKRNIVEYNHIHHLGWGELSDMGGVYTLGPSEGTSVSHNRIHHVYSLYYGGWGLYTDEGSTGIALENNLVYRCKSGGFHQHYGRDNVVRNNIFAGQLRTQLEATRVEDHLSFVFTNNIVYFDSGTLCGINWEKVGHRSDYNAYFDARQSGIRFGDIPFAEWQQKGQDTHSVVEDPGFADASRFDFTPENKRLLKKIRFVPFDFREAGVYGSAEWVEQAALSEELLEAFDARVAEYENLKTSDW